MSQKSILVIDDDPDIAEALQFMLETVGYSVTTSSQGDGIVSNGKALPDLILLDILLSGSDGRDICKRLKRDTTARHIPIIMISAHPGVEESVKAAGAQDFIAKPFDMDDLLQKIAAYLG